MIDCRWSSDGKYWLIADGPVTGSTDWLQMVYWWEVLIDCRWSSDGKYLWWEVLIDCRWSSDRKYWYWLIADGLVMEVLVAGGLVTGSTNCRWSSDGKYWLIADGLMTWSTDWLQMVLWQQVLIDWRWSNDRKYWLIADGVMTASTDWLQMV